MPVAPVVVDASALVAVLFHEPEGPSVRARLPEAGLVATAMIGFEVANAAVQKVRRGSVTQEQASAAMVLFGAMAIDSRLRRASLPMTQAISGSRAS